MKKGQYGINDMKMVKCCKKTSSVIINQSEKCTAIQSIQQYSDMGQTRSYQCAKSE